MRFSADPARHRMPTTLYLCRPCPTSSPSQPFNLVDHTLKPRNMINRLHRLHDRSFCQLTVLHKPKQHRLPRRKWLFRLDLFFGQRLVVPLGRLVSDRSILLGRARRHATNKIQTQTHKSKTKLVTLWPLQGQQHQHQHDKQQ